MYAQEEADRLDLTGWVRNCYDASVESIAEGEEQALTEFAAWCRQGPSHSSVTTVDADYSEATGELTPSV